MDKLTKFTDSIATQPLCEWALTDVVLLTSSLHSSQSKTLHSKSTRCMMMCAEGIKHLTQNAITGFSIGLPEGWWMIGHKCFHSYNLIMIHTKMLLFKTLFPFGCRLLKCKTYHLRAYLFGRSLFKCFNNFTHRIMKRTCTSILFIFTRRPLA